MFTVDEMCKLYFLSTRTSPFLTQNRHHVYTKHAISNNICMVFRDSTLRRRIRCVRMCSTSCAAAQTDQRTTSEYREMRLPRMLSNRSRGVWIVRSLCAAPREFKHASLATLRDSYKLLIESLCVLLFSKSKVQIFSFIKRLYGCCWSERKRKRFKHRRSLSHRIVTILSRLSSGKLLFDQFLILTIRFAYLRFPSRHAVTEKRVVVKLCQAPPD